MSITRRKAMAILAGAFPAAKSLRMFGQAPDPVKGPFLAHARVALRLPRPGMVSRRQVWHMGALGTAVLRRRRRLVCPQHVHPRRAPIQISRRALRTAVQVRLQGFHPSLEGRAKFDPEYLMGLYKKAGAKYFMSMGVHHDNFDLWNSAHNRWNSVNMGPKIDIVGMWSKAARGHGLKFGVSDHLWISYKWFSPSHYSDTEGPLAGVPLRRRRSQIRRPLSRLHRDERRPAHQARLG